MPILELLCDHPGCAGEGHQVLATVSNIIEAQKLIDAGEVRCPVHGVRTAPIQVGSTHMPAAVPVSEPPPASTIMGPGSKTGS